MSTSTNNKKRLLQLLLDGSITQDIYHNRLNALITNDIMKHNNATINNDHIVSKFGCV